MADVTSTGVMHGSSVCDRCGYALGISRVMLMVEGRALNDHRLCSGCLRDVLDVLQAKLTAAR